MTAGKIKLTSFLFISCLCISLLPLIIYMAISMFTFGRGLDTIHRSILIKSIIDHSSSLPVPDDIKVVNDISLLPWDIRSHLPETLENGRLYRDALKSDDGRIKEVFFLIAYEAGGKQYLSFQKMPVKDAESFIKPEAVQTLCILGVSSIIMLTAILLLIRHVVKRVLAPIRTLENWVSSLSTDTALDPLPQLAYPELYTIADFIKQKFIAEYERIKSEEDFWKFCSHELRTPISVIRVGINVIQKYTHMELCDFGKFNAVLHRLRKSAHSMSSIIETILWINRENGQLSRQTFDLSNMVSDIINDFRGIYLIDNCNLNVFTQKHMIEQPELAARIAIENMIRNAFQHSIGEEICVIQIKGTVKVINKLMPENLDADVSGFGLGLELVNRLAKKLGWEIKSLFNNQYYIISVKFK